MNLIERIASWLNPKKHTETTESELRELIAICEANVSYLKGRGITHLRALASSEKMPKHKRAYYDRKVRELQRKIDEETYWKGEYERKLSDLVHF